MWQVLLLGGASGVGKTSISYRLARHYGAALTEVDDIAIALEAMTSPDQYPELHYWRLQPEQALRMSDEEHVAFFRRYAEIMARALEPLIANHLETRTPVVLEGDFILPSLALRETYGDIPAGGQVRSLFLYEEDEEQIARNFFLRDGAEQPQRAHISWLVNEWLRQETQRLGVPAVSARPWNAVLERALRWVGNQ